MNTLNKTLLATAILVASSTAQASPFFVDLTGTAFGTTGIFGDADQITSIANELSFNYQSNTVIDLGANSLLNVGDSIVTTGGIDTTSLATVRASFPANQFSAFIPAIDSEGFTTAGGISFVNPIGNQVNWGLSFSFLLNGEIDAMGAAPNEVTEVSYSGGLIEIYLISFSAGLVSSYDNIFDLTVTGSNNSNASNFLVNGLVSFSGNEPASLVDLFHMTTAGCAGDTSFYALSQCTPAMNISFVLDQNLNNAIAKPGTVANTAIIGGDHNGSLTFNVPEPNTLMLLGISMLAFGAKRRKVN